MDKDFEEFRKQAEAKAMRGLFDEQTRRISKVGWYSSFHDWWSEEGGQHHKRLLKERRVINPPFQMDKKFEIFSHLNHLKFQHHLKNKIE